MKERPLRFNSLLIAIIVSAVIGAILYAALRNLAVSIAVTAGLILLLYAPLRTWIMKDRS